MNRTRWFSLASLVTAVTLAIAPITAPAAIAQSLPILEALDLTDEQQTQVQEILTTRRAEIDEILTDEQQQQFRETYQETQNLRTAITAVDTLTDAQKAELQTLLQASREDLSAVLTEEQRAELRSRLQERRR